MKFKIITVVDDIEQFEQEVEHFINKKYTVKNVMISPFEYEEASYTRYTAWLESEM